MKQFLLFALLAGATHACLPHAETKCVVTETPFPCFPIVGGSVYIQLMCNASSYMVYCDKNSTKILLLKKRIVTIYPEYRDRAEFFINNGTLKVTGMKKEDSGEYLVKIYHSNGNHVKNFSFHLEVKDDICDILFICLIILSALLLVMCNCCIFATVKCCRKSGNKKRELKSNSSLT